ncbi:KRAB-A domain-containing protein 2-like [Onthophagus taurus]|uniref:KRAB-A domain-containing protein 2-like n=1 Tax=Onthophagus taurus TaxID=166361 RepID=UPI0039BE3ADA
MLATWMAENNSNDWPSGLKYVQFHKNRAFHSGIGRSPYEAMFGCSARVGLASAGIPYDEIPNLNSEKDFEAAATAALQEDQQINETTLRIPADNAEDSTYDNTRDTTEDNRDDNDSTSEMKAPKQTKKTESDPEMNKRDKDLEPSQVSLKCNTCNT